MDEMNWQAPEVIELGEAAELTQAFTGGGGLDQDCMYRDRGPYDY